LGAGCTILEAMSTATAPITVTDAAARKIAQLSTKEGHAEPILRLRVVAGGCSGFSYELGFTDTLGDDDHVIAAAGGVRVLVDPRSAPIVEGSTLDLDTAMIGGGLKVRNPRAVHECACGDSFAI
jgi:iron-sulfur cluster assembly protein